MGRPATKMIKVRRVANRAAQAPAPNAWTGPASASSLPRHSLDDMDVQPDEDAARRKRRGAKREREPEPEIDAEQEDAIDSGGELGVSAMDESDDDDGSAMRDIDEDNDDAPAAAATPGRQMRATTAAATAASHQQALAAPPAQRRPGRVAGSLYADQQRVTNHKRAKMTPALTARMIEQDVANPDRTAAASAMAFDQALPSPRGLRDLGISRNHLTADSNVASLVHMAASDPHVAANPAHLHHFLRTLGGDDGDSAVAAFQESQTHAQNNRHGPAAAAKKRAIDLASMGSGNIRFDDAARNTHQLHGFDHEFDAQGRVTQRSHDNHHALLGLMHYPGMLEAAMNAAQPTIVPDRSGPVVRGEYVTSSGVARVGMQDPDAFAAPRPQPLRRSASMPAMHVRGENDMADD